MPVWYPKHLDSEPLEFFVASLVMLSAQLVWGTVHFDREACGIAIEINDVASNHLLAPEMQATQPAAAQKVPQRPLYRRHLSTEVLGESEQFRRNVLAVNYGS